MGRFIMSPDKFKSLEADAAHSDKIKSFKQTGEYAGVIDTADVTIDYNYDPTTQTLGFNVGKKHSLAAHMASDNVIERHITDVLFNLETAPASNDSNTIHVPRIPGTVNTPVGPEIPNTGQSGQLSQQIRVKPTIPQGQEEQKAS